MKQEVKIKEYWYEGNNLHLISVNGEHWILNNPYIKDINFNGLDIDNIENITFVGSERK